MNNPQNSKQASQTNVHQIASWMRERTSDELQNFIDSRLNAVGSYDFAEAEVQ